MSDVEEEEVVQEEEEEEEITDLISAIKKVLKNAMISDGVVRGLHGVAKALDAKKAQVQLRVQSNSFVLGMLRVTVRLLRNSRNLLVRLFCISEWPFFIFCFSRTSDHKKRTPLSPTLLLCLNRSAAEKG